MLLKFTEVTGHRATYGVQPSAAEPVVEVDDQYVSQRSGMTGGPNLVQLVVTGRDGREARAWVSVKLTPQGRPKFTLATCLEPSGAMRRKSLIAFWRKLTGG